MIWKLQITAVLDAYSMLDHLDGSIPKPSQFLTTEIGIQAVNPDFLLWNKKDKALLYSTLLVLPLSLPWLWGRVHLEKFGTH